MPRGSHHISDGTKQLVKLQKGDLLSQLSGAWTQLRLGDGVTKNTFKVGFIEIDKLFAITSWCLQH